MLRFDLTPSSKKVKNKGSVIVRHRIIVGRMKGSIVFIDAKKKACDA